jgi:hypothetical protein
MKTVITAGMASVTPASKIIQRILQTVLGIAHSFNLQAGQCAETGGVSVGKRTPLRSTSIAQRIVVLGHHHVAIQMKAGALRFARTSVEMECVTVPMARRMKVAISIAIAEMDSVT